MLEETSGAFFARRSDDERKVDRSRRGDNREAREGKTMLQSDARSFLLYFFFFRETNVRGCDALFSTMKKTG